MVDPERADNFRERRDVQCEQQRSEHRSLWNAVLTNKVVEQYQNKH